MLYDFQIQGFFLFIAASVADAAAVRPSTPNGLITDFSKGNPDFNNGAQNLKNSPFCILLNCAFENLISVDVWLAKALRRFATCLLFNNNLCGKLASSSELPIIFDDNLKITSTPFFIADFNLLSCEFDNFTFKLFYIRPKNYSMKLHFITYLQYFYSALCKI